MFQFFSIAHTSQPTLFERDPFCRPSNFVDNEDPDKLMPQWEDYPWERYGIYSSGWWQYHWIHPIAWLVWFSTMSICQKSPTMIILSIGDASSTYWMDSRWSLALAHFPIQHHKVLSLWAINDQHDFDRKISIPINAQAKEIKINGKKQ